MARWERTKVTALVHTVMLCAVFVLFLLATRESSALRADPVSAPILNWSYLTVVGNGYTTWLGTLGWCRTGGSSDYCSPRGVGLDVKDAVRLTLGKGLDVRDWYNTTSYGLVAVPAVAGESGLRMDTRSHPKAEAIHPSRPPEPPSPLAPSVSHRPPPPR
jgi:hypothetical protein